MRIVRVLKKNKDGLYFIDLQKISAVSSTKLKIILMRLQSQGKISIKSDSRGEYYFLKQ